MTAALFSSANGLNLMVPEKRDGGATSTFLAPTDGFVGGATAGSTLRISIFGLTVSIVTGATTGAGIATGAGTAAAAATAAFALVAAAAAAAAATTAAAAALSSWRCGPSARSPLRSAGSRERSRMRERPRDLCLRERPPPRSLECDRDCDRRLERFGDAEDDRLTRARDLCLELEMPDGDRERVRRRLERPGDADRDRSLGLEFDRRLDLERERCRDLERDRCLDLERDRCLDLERDRCLDLERNRCLDLERSRCLDLERERRDSRPLFDFFASP